jgi:hypothetical protein
MQYEQETDEFEEDYQCRAHFLKAENDPFADPHNI